MTIPTCGGASAAEPDLALTVAGVESTSVAAPMPCSPEGTCELPRGWPSTWTATDRRLAGSCLAHLTDGTILVCQGSELLALGLDGRLRRWLPPGVPLGLGELIDADVAPDGGVAILGREGVARVAGGIVLRLVPAWDPAVALGEFPYGSAVAARADGGVLLAGVNGVRAVLRPAALALLAVEGTRSTLRRSLPAGPAVRFTSDELDDLAVLADGSAVVAPHGRQRVLRIDARGHVRTLAERFGAVTALAGRPDGGLEIAAERGLFSISRTGRSRRLARGAGDPYEPVDAAALTTDGRRVSALVLAGVRRIVALDAHASLALVEGELGTRVIRLGPLASAGRLLVALPATNRMSLARGVVDVVATRAASAEIVVSVGDTVVSRAKATLRPGHNRVRVRVPSRPRAQVVAVAATDAPGAVASHRLAFLADQALSGDEVHRLVRLLQDSVGDAVSTLTLDRCASRAPRETICRWRIANEASSLDGTARFRWLRDGLISYTEIDRRGRIRGRRLLEPR